jgi:hypothetical protein
MSHHLKLFSGTANQQLASAIAGYLGTQMSVIDISRFRDGKLQIICKNIYYIYSILYLIRDLLRTLLDYFENIKIINNLFISIR